MKGFKGTSLDMTCQGFQYVEVNRNKYGYNNGAGHCGDYGNGYGNGTIYGLGNDGFGGGCCDYFGDGYGNGYGGYGDHYGFGNGYGFGFAYDDGNRTDHKKDEDIIYRYYSTHKEVNNAR